ncbi:unnamed protein product [Urochloa humidicola]
MPAAASGRSLNSRSKSQPPSPHRYRLTLPLPGSLQPSHRNGGPPPAAAAFTSLSLCSCARGERRG